MKRLRFSLRMFLIVVTLLAILLGIAGERGLRARKQQQLIALAESYGGETFYELNFTTEGERTLRFPNLDFSPTLPGPEWLRKRLGSEYFVEVVELLFDKGSHRVLDDAMFREFTGSIRSRNLPRVRGLVFGELPITDAALKELSTFPELTSLHITSCPGVTDQGLAEVGRLTKLRRLDVGFCSINGEGLVHLAKLNNLRELSLKRTGVSDDDLHHLEGLDQLEWLSLSDTQVTPEGIDKLSGKLPNCQIGW
jgi:hypothetical protein